MAKKDKKTALIQSARYVEDEIGAHWVRVLEDCRKHKSYTTWADTTRQIRAAAEECEESLEIYHARLKDLARFVRNADTSILIQTNRVSFFLNTIVPRILYRNPDRHTITEGIVGQGDSAMTEFFLRRLHSQSIEKLMNWGADRGNLYDENRFAITNGMLSGWALQQCVVSKAENSQLCVKNQAFSDKDFLCDPYAKNIEGIGWFARKNCLPKALFVERHGNIGKEFYSKDGDPHETIYFWEIYSKVGTTGGMKKEYLGDDIQTRMDEKYGRYVKIVLVEEYYGYAVEHRRKNEPLGKPKAISIESWPIEFWRMGKDGHDSPFTMGYFGERSSDSVYPIPPLASALKVLHNLNNTYTKLSDFINNIVAVLQVNSVGSAVKKGELRRALRKTFSVIEGQNTGDKDLFSLQQVNPELGGLLATIQMLKQEFDEMVGLDIIRYVADSASRSATDAQNRASVAGYAVEKYAAATQNFTTDAARKEAFVWRQVATAEDVARVIGPEAAEFWDEYLNAHRADIGLEFDVLVNADSARLPNRSLMRQLSLQNLEQEMSVSLQRQPPDFDRYNALARRKWELSGLPPEEYIPITAPQEIPMEMLQMLSQGQGQPGAPIAPAGGV